jgi:hypothetical protein
VSGLLHSAASAMLVGGVPLLTVSRMLGHSSVSITGDIYGHITNDGGRQAAAALAKALERRSDQGRSTATGTGTPAQNHAFRTGGQRRTWMETESAATRGAACKCWTPETS